MKHLILLLLVFTSHVACANDPVVVVRSATSVTVDGVDYGKPVDAISNNKALAPTIQTALEAWASQIEQAKATAEADLAAKTARINIVLASFLQEELKTGRGPRVEILERLIAEAGKPAEQLKREALEAEILEKQKALDALDK